MTDISDIPSSTSPHSRNYSKYIAGAAGIVGVFFFTNVIASEKDFQEFESTTTNAQTVKLLTPETFKLPQGSGGSTITTIDDALLGNRSALEGYDGGFAELTGHIKNLYIVREGDTISQIADSFEISQNTIIWANNLQSNKSLKVGSELIILPISGVIHTIEKGDTIESIAKKYEGEATEILSYNRITASELQAGDEITIPGGVIKQVATKTVAKSSAKVVRTGNALRTTRSSSGLLEVSSGVSYSWSNGVRTTQLRGTGGPTYTNYYMRPITGYGKSRGLHGFNSVDFAAPRGTPILASASGKVIVSKQGGWNGGYGNYVAIEHSNGTQTLYAHASSIIVSRGSNVVQGQIIGYVGSTGNSSGNHLHFEIRGAKNPF